MKFETYGGFELQRNRKLIAHSKTERHEFWAKVDEEEPGLSDACGCYVYVIGKRAWYVGMAEHQSFKSECFTPHKINQYNDALGQVAGRPSLLLLPKVTPGGRFAKPSKRGHGDIRLLESLLIGTALTRNVQLMNIKGTKLLKNMNVPGFLNSRQGQARAHSVQMFKRALGIT